MIRQFYAWSLRAQVRFVAINIGSLFDDEVEECARALWRPTARIARAELERRARMEGEP